MSEPLRLDLNDPKTRPENAIDPPLRIPRIPPPGGKSSLTGAAQTALTQAEQQNAQRIRPAVPSPKSVPQPAPQPNGQVAAQSATSAPAAVPHARPQAAPQTSAPPPPVRSLVRPAQPESRPGTHPATNPGTHKPSGFERVIGAMRAAIPMVQKILPLLDGNIASAASNILAPRPHAHPVDLAPVENALIKLGAEQQALRGQIAENNTSLKKVEDQLGMVKEATDRNTLEQQELLEDLHSMRKKVVVFAWVILAVLAVSVGVNMVLYLHIQHILP